VQVGQLDTKLIPESSGMAASKIYPDRLYHMNDSGTKPEFFITDLKGRNTLKIAIENYKPYDPEALSIGPCPASAQSCIFIGETGDNKIRRSAIEILVIEEQQTFPAQVSTLTRIKAQYPDGARDAEAMAVLPNGDLIIVSKEYKYGLLEQKGFPAHLYRLSAAQLADSTRTHTLQLLGELDLPGLVPGIDPVNYIVTDMSYVEKRGTTLLLTYGGAWEFAIDYATVTPAKLKALKRGTDFELIRIVELAQQETLTTTPEGFLYATEASNSEAPLYQVACTNSNFRALSHIKRNSP
jgi:hypothetical protein